MGGQLSTLESGYIDYPFHDPLLWGSGIDYMSSSYWRGHCSYEDSVNNKHPFKCIIFKPRASSDLALIFLGILGGWRQHQNLFLVQVSQDLR